MREGFNFWLEHGQNVNFKLMLSRHADGSDLEKAGVDLRAESAALGESHGVLFLEAVGDEKSMGGLVATLNEVSKTGDIPENIKASKSAWGHKISQIAGTGVQIALPDFRTNSTSPINQALEKWNRAIDQTYDNERSDPYTMLAKANALDFGNLLYRNFYIMGSMGHTLSQLHEQGKLGDPIEAGLLAGPLHETIGEELRGLGVSVAYEGTFGEKQVEESRLTLQAVRHATLSAPTHTELLASQIAGIEKRLAA